MGYEPELGQIVSGSTYTETGTPVWVTAGIVAIDDAVVEFQGDGQDGWNTYTSNSGRGEFRNEVFAIRSYCWADCDCPYDDLVSAWHEANSHEAKCYQTEFIAAGLDEYTFPETPEHQAAIEALCAKHGVDPTLGTFIHCTCSYSQRWAEWSAVNDHTSECVPNLPNFEHFASGVKAFWYKHARRGATINRVPDRNEWRANRPCLRGLSVTVWLADLTVPGERKN